MKKRSQKAKNASAAPSVKPQAVAPEIALSPARKWLFRIFSLLLLPILLLLVIECGLRIAGIGYDTAFFKKVAIDGKEFLTDNENFSLRFFPPQLARWPGPVMFEAKKPANTYRIFILGESAARGEPEPNYAASRYLQVMLQERFPQTRFEVINLGITAINSHVILPIAQDCANGDGDLWIIYMGNNEMVGPFGAATVFGAKAPPLPTIRLGLALQKTRLGQLILSLGKTLNDKRENDSWGGMKMFIGNQLRAEDPRRESVYKSFAVNLDEILNAGARSGASILLNTVAVNLKDCPPFASMENPHLSQKENSDLKAILAEAHKALENEQYTAATEKYFQAEKLDPAFPDLHYQLAECFLKTGDTAAARKHFQQASDLDALPFRADSRINSIIESTAKKNSGRKIVFFDASSALNTLSPQGICGREFFYEHVHFNFDGEFELGRLWASEVQKILPADIRQSTQNLQWISKETCDLKLGLTDGNRSGVINSVVDRLTRPPLSTQSNNRERTANLEAELMEMRNRMTPEAAQKAVLIYQESIRRSPADPVLYENFAEFCESGGDIPKAVEQWEKVCRLLPLSSYGFYHLGRLQAKLDHWEDAANSLRRAVELRPRLMEAWYELGNARFGAEKFESALEAYSHALLLNPSSGTYAGSAGNALARLNRHREAITKLNLAVSLQPDFWECYIMLGNELVAIGDSENAKKALKTAIQLHPSSTLAHINLGVIYARSGDNKEAIHEFEETLKLDPQNKTASDYLSRKSRTKSLSL